MDSMPRLFVELSYLDRIEKLTADNERLRAALHSARGELQCLYHWLDRAVTSDYRYNSDPALPGHRKAAEDAAQAITVALGDEQNTRGQDARGARRSL